MPALGISRLDRLVRIAATALLLAVVHAPNLPASAQSDGAAYEQALQNFESGEYGEAIVRLKNILQKDQGDIVARLLLGRAYLRRGEGAAAEVEFKDARRRGAADRIVLGLQAQSLLLQEKHADVIDQISAAGQGDELEAEILVLHGHAYVGLGKLEAAEAAFAGAARLIPGALGPLLGQARSEIVRGNFDAAAALLGQDSDLHENDAELWLYRGDIERLLGHFQAATDHYDRALALDPYHFQARLSRAAMLIDLGQGEKARPDLDLLERVAPKNLQVSYLRAVLLVRDNDLAAAQEGLTKAWERIGQGDRDRIMHHGPSLLLAGTLNYTQGHLEDAKKYFDRYLELNPHHIETRKLLGTILIEEVNPTGAIAVMRPALDLSRDDPALFALLGNAYLQAGRHDKAGEMYEQAVALAPDQSRLLAGLALSRLAGGKSDEAVGLLEPVTANDPDAVLPGVLLSYAHLRNHAYDKALASVRQLTSRVPPNPLLLNLAGVARLGLEDHVGARKDFEAALNASPGYLPALLNLARLDTKTGDLRAAAERFEAILEQERNNSEALQGLAQVAIAEGRLEDAARWLERILLRQPDAVGPLLLLVDVYMGLNRPEDVQTLAQKVESRESSSPVVGVAYGRVALANGNLRAARQRFHAAARMLADQPQRLEMVARLQAAAGDSEGARRSLATALEAAPGFVTAQATLATLEAAAGNDSEAMAIAEQLREDHPRLALGDLLVGDLHRKAHRHAAAIAAYDAAMIKQATPGLVVRIYEVRVTMGDWAGALSGLESWLKDHPRDLLVRRSLASGYLMAGRAEAAVKEHEVLLAVNPDDAALLNNLAWLYHEAGDRRARDYAERAYTLAPDDPGVIDTLGLILAAGDDPNRGLALLREAFARGLDEAMARYHIAVALDKLGQKDAARQEVEQALALNRDFAGAAEAKALHKRLSTSP